MEFLTFEDLQERIRDLYHTGEYAAALELAAEETGHFPEYDHLLAYWQITLAARAGDPEMAITRLKDVLSMGFWYGEALLRKSPSLRSLQGNPEFEKLVALNRRLQEEEHASQFPMIVLRSQGHCQSGGPPCPSILALHADAATAQFSLPFWQPAASAGWLVGVVQSSQAMWKGAYVWNDREITRHEIQQNYVSLAEQYAVDPARVVLAGHAAGGEAAAWLALSGTVEVCGFLTFGPVTSFTSEPDSWEPLIAGADDLNLRAYLIVGEEDETVDIGKIQDFAGMLNQGGIACEVEEVPHAGSDYAPEYESSLLRALEFLTNP